MNPHDAMIRVYRLPDKLSDGFCFGKGTPITFTNVDWFNAVPPLAHLPEPTQADLIAFIRAKNYYDPDYRFLVLDDRPERTFVIARQSDAAACGRGK